MSQELREQLSSLLDDELDAAGTDAALRELSGDQELRATWGRYHLIGDALRGEPVMVDAMGVADRVRERLAQEPVPLRPHHGTPRWLVQVGGWAMAASLALVAIVSGPALFRGDLDTSLTIAEQPPPMSALYVDRTGYRWGVRRPEVELKLDRFLANHQDYSPVAGMKSMVPYATLASYELQH
jgi:sigma-E factor negative regulatory protein RseA